MNENYIEKVINIHKQHTFDHDLEEKNEKLRKLYNSENIIFLFLSLFGIIFDSGIVVNSLFAFIFLSLFKLDLFFSKKITIIISLLSLIAFFTPLEVELFTHYIFGLLFIGKFLQKIVYSRIKKSIEKDFEENIEKKYKSLKIIYKDYFRNNYSNFEDFLENIENISKDDIKKACQNYQNLNSA